MFSPYFPRPKIIKAFQRDYLTRLKWAKSWLVGWMRIGLRFSHYFRNFQLLLRIFFIFFKSSSEVKRKDYSFAWYWGTPPEDILQSSHCHLWQQFQGIRIFNMFPLEWQEATVLATICLFFKSVWHPYPNGSLSSCLAMEKLPKDYLRPSCHWLEGIDNLWRYSKKYFQNCWPTNRM